LKSPIRFYLTRARDAVEIAENVQLGNAKWTGRSDNNRQGGNEWGRVRRENLSMILMILLY